MNFENVPVSDKHLPYNFVAHCSECLDQERVMPFQVNCRLCRKKFRTDTSLTKHFHLKHPQSSVELAKFEDDFGVPCAEPKAAAISDEKMEDYLKWLGVLVERINASLVPDHPGKLFSIRELCNCIQTRLLVSGLSEVASCRRKLSPPTSHLATLLFIS